MTDTVATCSSSSVTSTTLPTTTATIEAFESLNKWKNGATSLQIPPRMVYQHNRSKAASKGFPSVLEVGQSRGLTDHEVAALYGWTTGDYRMVNPIARGLEIVEFEDYPLLPQDLSKVTFTLTKEDVLPYIQILKAALSKLPSDGQRVWRGHKRPLPRNVGSTFVLEGFASATLDRDNALEFCTQVAADGSNQNQRTLICMLSSQSGKSISKFSARPEEMEVIFLPDTKFEVVDAPTSSENDQKAVKHALEGLREKLPEATIHLLYVKEVEA
ncbi:expressed unknown protein [Seminavis robusta]|uniref:NAD(P)(+)--arginine ADP-ribosyltransferase n=1 Tax=Seminavis robusta TaxID=568900 RepID=A0A9N8H826_9STRA|nr:expressed unknown protein [Seminavis robusta]|eukprot:Sro202_g085310.1 n/a (272) ;mRNA; f:14195-15010